MSAVADHIMTIENSKINIFAGAYEEYLSKVNKCITTSREEVQDQIIILENRLSEIIGKLSMQLQKDILEALDKEYYEILDKLKKLKATK